MNRFGLHPGVDLGPPPWQSNLASDPYSGVTADGGLRFPATSQEWSTFNAANGSGMSAPTSLYLCQDASGNLTDAFGVLALTAGGTGLGYAAAVTGLTRKGVTFTDAGSGHFTVAAASGPNPSATSVLWFGIFDLTVTPAANRNILSGGGAAAGSEVCAKLTTGSKVQAKALLVTADGASDAVTPGLLPVVMKYDRTNSAFLVYTNVDKITGTYGAGVTDGAKGFGATQATSAGMTLTYGAYWSGAAAEISDANIKKWLQGHGFTVTWT